MASFARAVLGINDDPTPWDYACALVVLAGAVAALAALAYAAGLLVQGVIRHA